MSFLQGSASNNKKVTCYSWVIIILALIGILNVALQWFGGELSTDYMLKNVPGISVDIINIVIISILSFSVISALIKLFIGIKGLKEVKGTSKGAGYITLAKIWLFFEVIALIAGIIGIFNGERNYITLLSSLAFVIILYDFSKSCKEIREGR